ncbi:MAG: ATP-binding protein [Alphaproteobacteria bacterium]
MLENAYRRWQIEAVVRTLKEIRVVLLTGPRQCGKTTLAKTLNVPNQIYKTLDKRSDLADALKDPEVFINHGDELLIIDEIQRAPELLLAIKLDVDTNQKYGRFLITGSTNLRAIPTATESLAGRIGKIRLRPLAQGEIVGTRPNFLKNIFQSIALQLESKGYEKDDYLSMAIKGGYPEALLSGNIKRWHKKYISTLLDRDLEDILNIRRQGSMQTLIKVLAAWSSKFINMSSISANLAVSRPTLDTYINALEALYIVESIEPWTKTDYSRTSRQNKFFMTDSGLMSSMLNWTLDKVRLDGDLSGKLMETFVFTQLAAIIDCQDEDYALTHYRDVENREIDFIIENDDGHLLGIEVKAGGGIGRESFKHLRWFKEHIAKDKPFTGIVLYTGDRVVSFGNGMWAAPISALWNE